MSLRDIATKALKTARAGSAMSHVGDGDGKPLREEYVITIKQRVLAGDRKSVDVLLDLLESKLQNIGGLAPLIEMCDLENPVIADGFPKVSVEEK